MRKFRTEGDARQYVEENPDEVVLAKSLNGRVWFGIVDGKFTVYRAASDVLVAVGMAPAEATEPHEFEALGDDQELPAGAVEILPKEETPLHD